MVSITYIFDRNKYIIMKKMKLLAFVAVLISGTAMAQSTTSKSSSPKAYLNGAVGYTFDESFPSYYGEWKYKGNVHYGASAEFVLQGASNMYNERTVELLWQYMTSDMEQYSYYNNISNKLTGTTAVNFVTIGGNNYFGKSRKIMGFGGLALGAAFINAKATVQNVEYSDNLTKFAMNIKGGGRFMFNDKVGLKLYAQLNSIVGGAGVYFGTGGTGVSTYSTVLQFGLGGGLTVGLGN